LPLRDPVHHGSERSIRAFGSLLGMMSRFSITSVALWGLIGLASAGGCPYADPEALRARAEGEDILGAYKVDDSEGFMSDDVGGQIADQDSLRAGERGPTLLEDFILRQKITHFDHERVSLSPGAARNKQEHAGRSITHANATRRYLSERFMLAEQALMAPSPATATGAILLPRRFWPKRASRRLPLCGFPPSLDLGDQQIPLEMFTALVSHTTGMLLLFEAN
jgi:hypothetical protein